MHAGVIRLDASLPLIRPPVMPGIRITNGTVFAAVLPGPARPPVMPGIRITNGTVFAAAALQRPDRASVGLMLRATTLGRRRD
jgi:hypothetical protein